MQNMDGHVTAVWIRADPDPAATMSSKRAKGKTTKKRPQRATSNVFAMFDQSQIQEFKEAFNMIDQNRDGFIDKEDLHDMLASLGTCRGGGSVSLYAGWF